LSATTSMILPNCPNNAYIHFLSSARNQETKACCVPECICHAKCFHCQRQLAFLGQLLIQVVDVDGWSWGNVHGVLARLGYAISLNGTSKLVRCQQPSADSCR
jgi:hypothetical protein